MSNADPPTYVDNILELITAGSIPMNGRSDPIMVATGEVQPASLSDLLETMRAVEREAAARRAEVFPPDVNDGIRSQAITALEDYVSTRIVESLVQLGILPSTLRGQPTMLIRVPVLPYMLPPDASVDARQSMLDSLCNLFAMLDNRNGRTYMRIRGMSEEDINLGLAIAYPNLPPVPEPPVAEVAQPTRTRPIEL